ncbi:MAG: BfmA/BtgA family mobilization protein [Dysgonomonas sp.]|nr:BfmA/BtgA family mobilization protein [Dysgonomonas sp.]
MDTTVTISDTTAKKLNKICKTYEISKRKFIDVSLDYFLKYGINPMENESPIQEVERIRKRIDQLISFQRVMEKDRIIPMFDAIITSESQIQQYLDSLAKNDLLLKMISDLQQFFSKSHQVNTERDNEIKESLMLLAQAIENKDMIGLANKLKNIFDQ